MMNASWSLVSWGKAMLFEWLFNFNAVLVTSAQSSVGTQGKTIFLYDYFSSQNHVRLGSVLASSVFMNVLSWGGDAEKCIAISYRKWRTKLIHYFFMNNDWDKGETK
ncbi:hypothetical protein [Marinomonas transparens]|uniref:Uncharacterized protein n=1 Tax=Marinomonas transparens TaxID=2795388 RepID=A0A934JTS2_9GAMM|nr:hypothetical protein [Marinomonas transparens]MBJ7538157.1 hypothetical protein [Marinomonas transparens]